MLLVYVAGAVSAATNINKYGCAHVDTMQVHSNTCVMNYVHDFVLNVCTINNLCMVQTVSLVGRDCGLDMFASQNHAT